MARICNAAFPWLLQGKRMLCINISCPHKSCHIQRRQGCELQYPTHQYAHPNLYQCNWLQVHQTCRHQIDDSLLQHYPLESGGNCAHDDWVHLILEKVWKTLVMLSCFRKVYYFSSSMILSNFYLTCQCQGNNEGKKHDEIHLLGVVSIFLWIEIYWQSRLTNWNCDFG